MTVELGWWLVPGAVTVSAYIWFHLIAREDFNSGGYITGLGAFMGFLGFLAITGITWAIYFAVLYFTKG